MNTQLYYVAGVSELGTQRTSTRSTKWRYGHRPWRPSNSTPQDRRVKANKQISNDFAKFIPENIIPDLSNGDPTGEKAENDTSEVVNSMNNSTSETLGNFSGDGSVKCHFTTMSDCIENKSHQNRVVYQPFNESDLLPKTQILDHTIFYKGIDNGEQLTEKFGKYN